MLKAIILEDEEDSCKLLKGYLNEYCPQVEIVHTAETIADAHNILYNYPPDLAFLDIEIQGENPFSMLEKLQPISFDIIFTTAHQEYMLKAIRLSAVDYLVKPINIDELKAAVEKVEQRHDQTVRSRSLEVLLNNIKGNVADQKIAVSATDGFIFIKISDIIYLESEGSYTYFYLKQNKKLITSKNLKEYEDLLTSHNFFRIHKSYIVNVAEINKYVRGDGGTVVMSNNSELEVSRRRKDEFLELLRRA